MRDEGGKKRKGQLNSLPETRCSILISIASPCPPQPSVPLPSPSDPPKQLKQIASTHLVRMTLEVATLNLILEPSLLRRRSEPVCGVLERKLDVGFLGSYSFRSDADGGGVGFVLR